MYRAGKRPTVACNWAPRPPAESGRRHREGVTICSSERLISKGQQNGFVSACPYADESGFAGRITPAARSVPPRNARRGR